jgi:hypothetical protein
VRRKIESAATHLFTLLTDHNQKLGRNRFVIAIFVKKMNWKLNWNY